MNFKKYVTHNFIFNNPDFDLNNLYKYKQQLIFIEKGINKNDKENYIPCLFFLLKESQNFMIYFHGNSEDIFQSELIGVYFKSYLKMNVIIVEYPGYSIYKSDKKEPNQLFDDSIVVFDWVINYFKIQPNNIIICGRSLGTSVALYLSSKKSPQAVILISPFRSMKSIADKKWYSSFIEDIFNSEDYINNVKCHILFIHGMKDNLISCTNSSILHQKCDRKKSMIKLQDNMEHNKFDIINDIINNILIFIKEFSLFETNGNLTISNENIKQLFQFPIPVSKWVEEELFNISNFTKKNIIPRGSKNYYKSPTYLLSLLDGRIAITFDSIITICDEKYYNIDYEIDLHKGTIFHVTQTKNGILISCSDKGEIIFNKIEIDKYILIKILKEDSKVYKCMELKNGLICCCSEKEIFLLDLNNYSKSISIENQCNYINFLEIESIIIFASEERGLISIYDKENNNLKKKFQISHMDVSYSNDNLIRVNKGILIGGYKRIQFLDNNFNHDLRNDFNINSNIQCIAKLNDNILLLGSYNCIYQYNPNNNNISCLKNTGTVFSIVIQKLNKFIAANQETLRLYTISKKENCNII